MIIYTFSQNPLLEDPSYASWSENTRNGVHDDMSDDHDDENSLFRRCWRKCRSCQVPPDRSKRIDVVSRYLFPLVFAVFNLAYWTTYLMQAQAEFESLNKIGST